MLQLYTELTFILAGVFFGGYAITLKLYTLVFKSIHSVIINKPNASRFSNYFLIKIFKFGSFLLTICWTWGPALIGYLSLIDLNTRTFAQFINVSEDYLLKSSIPLVKPYIYFCVLAPLFTFLDIFKGRYYNSEETKIVTKYIWYVCIAIWVICFSILIFINLSSDDPLRLTKLSQFLIFGTFIFMIIWIIERFFRFLGFSEILFFILNFIFRFEKSLINLSYSNQPNKNLYDNKKALENRLRSNISNNIKKEPQLVSPAKNQDKNKSINENTVRNDLLSNYPNASIAIEYRRDAKEGWVKIQKMPLEFSIEFLKNLETDAKQDITSLIENINKRFNLSISPFDDEKLAKAYLELNSISPEASSEFEKAINTLGGSVPLEQIVEKIKLNYLNK